MIIPLKLYNATTLATIGTRCIIVAVFIATFFGNFRESPKGEARRIL